MNADILPPAVTAECVPALIKGLESRDWAVRSAVTNLLGRLGPKAGDAVPDLLRILTDPVGKDGPVPGYARQNLASAASGVLGRIAPGSEFSEEAIARLTDTLRSGDRILQSPAIYALSHFGPDAAPAIPVLIQLVRESGPGHNVNIEQEAARALGLIAPDTPLADKAVTALLGVLRSDSGPARIAAIEALGHFGTKSAIAVPKIRSLCDDRDALVKQAAEARARHHPGRTRRADA